MLVDKVRVDFFSGKGGNGEGGLLTEYPVTDGGPGGYGGSVILEGDENIYDLKNFTAVHEYTAGDGDKGKRGKSLKVFVELHLKADILFIGFPNAGKSSMLNALCGSKYRVANYPFTTLEPQLGKLRHLTLMDLPGLIEGSFEGKGLGTKFTRHTKTADRIAHFVSLESEDVVGDYKKMREELKNIDIELYNSKEIVVLNKSDLVDEETAKKKLNEMKKLNPNTIVVSAYNPESVVELADLFLKASK